MDKAALALRNEKMAQAFHATPLKHRVRHAMLKTIAQIPIRQQREPLVNRILIIRPDHLGDVLLTTPAIHVLREALPDTEIHALVGPWSAGIIARYPEVDQVLTLPFPGFSRRSPKSSLRSPYELAISTARNLRLIGYSQALILRPDHWWGAMLAFLAGVPQRVGYATSDVAPFLTHTIEPRREHAVVQNLRLVEVLTRTTSPDSLRFDFPLDSLDTAYIDGYLEQWGIKNQQPIFCIHPGSGTAVKHWQDDQWATVADTLIEQLDAAVVLTGSDQELELVRGIAAQMTHPACITAGDTQVGQLAALFARARVVLGPDSGPLHLAAAVGAPTVTLFGPADPVEFGPWGDRDKHPILTLDIACRPCRVLDWASDGIEYHPCVRDIPLGAVLEAARRAAN